MFTHEEPMKNFLNDMKNSLPRYNAIQPSTGKKVTFRPFTVKEEKSLLISNSTGNHEDFLTTLGHVIDSCFDLDVSANDLPIFDVEYFFLQLRCKSIGELIQPTIVCQTTKEKIDLNLNLEEINPVYFDNHTKEIKLDNFIVNMKYPTLNDFINKKENEDYYDMMIKCIDTIESPKELIETKNANKEDIQEFIELLTKPQFNKIVEFFKTMPKIEKEIAYRTSDGVERKLLLKGIRDFFQ
jgi:hypothetical protein